MNKITMNKADLREVLKANREGHAARYEKAFDGYRAECIRVLEENLEMFRKGQRSAIVWNERAPQNMTKDYDRVISMLDHHVGNEIEITMEEFAHYVQDDWQWSQVWTTSNSKYLGR